MIIKRLSVAGPILIIFFLPIVTQAGETLYNGIQLPNRWPPTRSLEELRAGTPMEVPYLKHSPAVIPIDVGRQLLVDNFLVESTTLERVFHKPVSCENNPVLRPNRRWEVGFTPHSAMCFSDGVFFDPRDGYHFDRPHRKAVLTTVDDPNAWNYGNVQSVAGGGVIVGDRFYMYASGRNSKEDTTGLYIWRRDGFVSMNAGQTEGTLTTRPLCFRGRHLFVNLAADDGRMDVELLDQDGRVLAHSKTLARLDKTLVRVGWADVPDLSQWSGQPVRFRFRLQNVNLYAFWVTPDESGASYGYVAGGGPGLTGPIDAEGIHAYEALAESK